MSFCRLFCYGSYDMCFSAAASITAGISLGAVGGGAIRQTRHAKQIPFAAIPLFFGVQQLAEGAVWLSLASTPIRLAVAKYAYLIFSHVLWPTLVPLSIYIMEPDARRRRALSVFVFAGMLISGYFSYFLVTETIGVQVMNASIAYVSPHFFNTVALTPYSIVICVSCLVSSYRFVNVFGLAVFLAAIAASRLYTQTFVSVWCFFAAVLSIIVYLHFYSERKRNAGADVVCAA